MLTCRDGDNSAEFYQVGLRSDGGESDRVWITYLAEKTEGNHHATLHQMFGPNGNPTASNLFEIVAYLQQAEGVRFEVRSTRRVTHETATIPPANETHCFCRNARLIGKAN